MAIEKSKDRVKLLESDKRSAMKVVIYARRKCNKKISIQLLKIVAGTKKIFGFY